MPDERNYYVVCEDNCKFPAMTKQQVIDKLNEEVEAHGTRQIAVPTVNSIVDVNGKKPLSFWIGTLAEYNSISEPAENTLYIIKEHNATKQTIISRCNSYSSTCDSVDLILDGAEDDVEQLNNALDDANDDLTQIRNKITIATNKVTTVNNGLDTLTNDVADVQTDYNNAVPSVNEYVAKREKISTIATAAGDSIRSGNYVAALKDVNGEGRQLGSYPRFFVILIIELDGQISIINEFLYSNTSQYIGENNYRSDDWQVCFYAYSVNNGTVNKQKCTLTVNYAIYENPQKFNVLFQSDTSVKLKKILIMAEQEFLFRGTGS